jgi:hypothetical protein
LKIKDIFKAVGETQYHRVLNRVLGF